MRCRAVLHIEIALDGINLGVSGIRIKIHQAVTVFLKRRDETHATSPLATYHSFTGGDCDSGGLLPGRGSDSSAADSNVCCDGNGGAGRYVGNNGTDRYVGGDCYTVADACSTA